MFTWTKSSDVCLSNLGWPALKAHRDYLSVSLLHDIIHDNIAVNFSDFCSFVTSCTRQHSLAIAPVQSIINSFRYFFC